MKTDLAKDMCNDFSKSSLEQISRQCEVIATILQEQGIMRNKRKENFQDCLSYMQDANDFKMLQKCLNKIIENIE